MSSGQGGLSPEMKARLQECYTHGNQKMNQKNHDYATEMFIQCLLGDPGNVLYIQAFVVNLRLKFGENKKGKGFGFLKGVGSKTSLKTALARKNWDSVLKTGADMLKSDPWDAVAYTSMGTAVWEMGYPFASLVYYKLAIESSPNDLEINRTCARALQEMEEYDQAIACWSRVLKLKPNDDEARKAIGDLAVEKTMQKGKYGTGNLQEAKLSVAKRREEIEHVEYEEKVVLTPEEQFEKNVRKSPDDPALYLDHADYLFQINKIKQAEDILHRLLKVKDIPEYRLKLLEVQRRRLLDDVTKIKNDFETSTKSDVKEKLKDLFTKRKEELNNITFKVHTMRVELNPGNSSFKFDLGLIYQTQGQYKEAIAEFQAAKADTSIAGDCLLALGQCFQQIKQYKLAMTHYQQAIKAIVGDGETKKKSLYLATRLSYGLQDYDTAEEYASQLAAIDFSYKDIGELLDKIAEKRKN